MITTPFTAETVGHSPSFIGSLVGSNIATVIAVTIFVTLLILVQALQLHIPFQVSIPNTLLFIVSFRCKFSLTHIDATKPITSTTNELYSIGSLHQKTFNEVFAYLKIYKERATTFGGRSLLLCSHFKTIIVSFAHLKM